MAISADNTEGDDASDSTTAGVAGMTPSQIALEFLKTCPGVTPQNIPVIAQKYQSLKHLIMHINCNKSVNSGSDARLIDILGSKINARRFKQYIVAPLGGNA